MAGSHDKGSGLLVAGLEAALDIASDTTALTTLLGLEAHN